MKIVSYKVGHFFSTFIFPDFFLTFRYGILVETEFQIEPNDRTFTFGQPV